MTSTEEEERVEEASTIELGLEVTECLLRGDGRFAASHIFNLRVNINQHMFTIQRSYVAFCSLHVRLGKLFPRLELPLLPLSASLSQFIRKKRRKRKDSSALDSLETSSTHSRASLASAVNIPMDNQGVDHMKAVVGKNEVVSQKRQALSNYLMELKDLPPVALSSPFLAFLDEASEDGEEVDSPHVDVVDILLYGERCENKTVVRRLTLKFQVPAGQFVAWKFSTKRFDIGFSAAFNGLEVKPYERVPSHVDEAKGSVEAKESGLLVLTWDNGYSLLRSKRLSYAAKMFTRFDVDSARDISRQRTQNEARLDRQRHLLLRALQRSYREVYLRSSVVLSPTASPLVSGRSLSVEDEFEAMTRRLASLTHVLSEERAHAGRQTDLLEEVTVEKEQLQVELRDSRVAIEQMERDLQTSHEQIAELQRSLQSARDEAKLSEEALQQAKKELSERSADWVSAEEAAALVEENTKLKAEKKQLRAYALQMKADCEEQTRLLQEERMARESVSTASPVASAAKSSTATSTPLRKRFSDTDSSPKPKFFF